MKFYIAPVQGHTDAAWRYFHHKHYGGNLKYFTPFMRCEKGDIRQKDIRDFTNPLNEGFDVEPQVIFKNVEELAILLSALIESYARQVNLNMGCPFPPQTVKGRGAGFISNVSEAQKMTEFLEQYKKVKFSVKMRLGLTEPNEWKALMPLLNSLQLDNLYVHPRVGRQQYKGELFLDIFSALHAESKNPVVFNGEIKTPGDAEKIITAFPGINGIMLGRGILGRPSLASELEDGEWPREQRIETLMKFHSDLFNYYCETLCGDSQILSKIKPFWEYAGDEIGRKAWKAFKKASNLAAYKSALNLLK